MEAEWHEQEPVWLLEAMHSMVDVMEATGVAGRHLRGRRGERQRIPQWVRRAVCERDGWTCQACGDDMAKRRDAIEIDHVMPWSAGGSDDATNLRVLCWSCNQIRSNFRDCVEKRFLPVATWCDTCYPGIAADLLLAYCTSCHATGYAAVRRSSA